MNISDFKQSMKHLFKANLTGFVWGHAGIGKTSAVKQVAQELGYKFFPFYLGTQSDIGDVLGLAAHVYDANGNPTSTKFAMPEWMKNMIEHCEANPDGGAIIFLDEFNRGHRDILNGMFSLALDKTFHTITLPANCHIIAAGNPPTDEYFTTDVNETALMARFCHIKLEPTTEEWTNYATKTGIDPNIISFIQEQPDFLEAKHSDFTLPTKRDRRSWERLNRLAATGIAPNLFEELAIGMVGLEATIAYKAHLDKAEKPLTAEEIFELSKDTKKKIARWATPDNVVASLIHSTLDNLRIFFTDRQELVEESKTDKFIEVMKMLPRDIFFSFYYNMTTQNPSPAFQAVLRNKKYDDEMAALVLEGKKVAEENGTAPQSEAA